MTDIVHDWTHYNRWVDTVGDGVGRPDAPQTSRTDWWGAAKALAVCVLAFGVAVALMLWAWRDPKIVVPDVNVEVKQPHSPFPTPHMVEKRMEDQNSGGKVVRNRRDRHRAFRQEDGRRVRKATAAQAWEAIKEMAPSVGVKLLRAKDSRDIS